MGIALPRASKNLLNATGQASTKSELETNDAQH